MYVIKSMWSNFSLPLSRRTYYLMYKMILVHLRSGWSNIHTSAHCSLARISAWKIVGTVPNDIEILHSFWLHWNHRTVGSCCWSCCSLDSHVWLSCITTPNCFLKSNLAVIRSLSFANSPNSCRTWRCSLLIWRLYRSSPTTYHCFLLSLQVQVIRSIGPCIPSISSNCACDSYAIKLLYFLQQNLSIILLDFWDHTNDPYVTMGLIITKRSKESSWLRLEFPREIAQLLPREQYDGSDKMYVWSYE